VRSDELEVRLVPLDERVTRLLARDSYQSLQSLVHSRRSSIDSLAKLSGISAPGLALVTFFGGREGARFDPQTLTLVIRNGVLRPRGIVPFSPRFTSQQLNVREQVSAIFLFDELLPVTDDFSFSYQGRNSEDWQNKQRLLDRERGRVAARSRVTRPDSGAPRRIYRPEPKCRICRCVRSHCPTRRTGSTTPGSPRSRAGWPSPAPTGRG
jgi:hypothetical protein